MSDVSSEPPTTINYLSDVSGISDDAVDGPPPQEPFVPPSFPTPEDFNFMSDVSSGGDEDEFVQPPNLRLLRSGKTTVRRGREERARERTKVQREKRDTKLMLYRLKGKLPEDLRLPTPRYGNRRDRSKRWRRILKTQTGKGGASEDDSDSEDSDDDIHSKT